MLLLAGHLVCLVGTTFTAQLLIHSLYIYFATYILGPNTRNYVYFRLQYMKTTIGEAARRSCALTNMVTSSCQGQADQWRYVAIYLSC
jgi:hypothetical protein